MAGRAMREIVLDTETTGLDPLLGDRVVEIAALELVNHLPPGRHYHTYQNPERDMPAEAYAVHGLSSQFLADKPLFQAEADRFLAFIADAPLVIHNAAFDVKFLNAELQRLRRPPLSDERLIDTLLIARRRFPGAPASLDALCRRFSIDLSVRTLHGALIDCELLAAVYLEMIGGRQPGLMLASAATPERTMAATGRQATAAQTGAAVRESSIGSVVAEIRPPRLHAPTAEELERHRAFVAHSLTGAIWLRGDRPEDPVS
jgi:DNA polymerase-3 subunit epsilon